VPDLSSELGPGWADLDVEVVGELWLDLALGLRLGDSEAASAAAGWDGGTYRAWSDGEEVAVVLSTVWDTEADAREFAAAIGSWLEAGGQPDANVLPVEDSGVRILFASSAATLSSLASAAAAA
jgi:hypothetical protein